MFIYSPRPEFSRRVYSLPVIVFSDTEHKALTHRLENIIFLDRAHFLSQPEIIKIWILGHETGHKFYFDETKADIFGANYLIKKKLITKENLRFFYPTENYISDHKRKKILYNYLKSYIHEK